MNIDINGLRNALRMFGQDENGTYLFGRLYDMPIQVLANRSKGMPQESTKQSLACYLRMIGQDIWKIATVVERLRWMQDSGDSIQHIDQRWMYYAAVDVEHFHVEMRSIMDYAAKSIAEAFGPKNLPESFDRLQNGIAKYRRIPETIKSLVAEAKWFPEMRGIRNALVHTGADTTIFGKRQEGILFQVFDADLKNLISHEAFLFNANVVRFEPYAAYFFCTAIAFLEDLCGLLSKDWKFDGPVGSVRSYSPGFTILWQWSSDLLRMLEEKEGEG